MSWNKNTLNNGVSCLINYYKRHSIDFDVVKLGKVIGLGLNDYDDISYIMRAVISEHGTNIEFIERTYDCDDNDIITYMGFANMDVPETFIIDFKLHDDKYATVKETQDRNERRRVDLKYVLRHVRFKLNFTANI